MPWTVDKRTHGWWYVRRIAPGHGGYSQAAARRIAAERNRERRRSKWQAYAMALRAYERAEREWPDVEDR
jgi:hypothetical protein